MDGEEAFFVREDAVRRDVTEARDKHEEADELQVISRQEFETQKICLHDEQKPNDKTRHKDPHFAGHGLTWSGTQPIGENGHGNDDAGYEHDDTVREIELCQ